VIVSTRNRKKQIRPMLPRVLEPQGMLLNRHRVQVQHEVDSTTATRLRRSTGGGWRKTLFHTCDCRFAHAASCDDHLRREERGRVAPLTQLFAEDVTTVDLYLPSSARRIAQRSNARGAGPRKGFHRDKIRCRGTGT